MIKNKIKLMDICVWVCAICYLFAFFSTYFKINGEYARYEAIYAEMLKESNDFNNSNDYNNSAQLKKKAHYLQTQRVRSTMHITTT